MAQLGKGLLGRLVGAGVAIAVALGIGVVLNKGGDKVEEAKAPDVGECVYFEKDGVNDKTVDAKCDDAKASHKVVADDGDCGQGETTFQITRGAGSDAIVDLCLVLNAKAGDCFDTEENKVDCDATKGQATVQKIASVGKAGDTCANPGQPYEFTKRDILLCVVPNA